jgi:benzaldehyde dehydrogenase (NAD)
VQVGPIVSERQAANVERVVTETLAKGARLRTGGSRILTGNLTIRPVAN